MVIGLASDRGAEKDGGELVRWRSHEKAWKKSHGVEWGSR